MVSWRRIGQEAQAHFLQETHVPQQEAGVYKAKCRGFGFESFWTGATATGQGGTHGGTAVLMDSRVKATHMTAKPGTRNVLPEALPYHNFTPVVG